MENNTLFKDIEKLIETIDGEDFSEVGMLVNSLQSLNAVANEGSIRGLSDAIYSIQTALSSLHSMTKSAPIQKNIENIQGNMNKMFSSIESMSDSVRVKTMKSYANSVNQITGNYQKRAAESGKLFTQVSPDTANSKWLGNMKRNNEAAYNSVTNGILLMQEKAWNDSMDAIKRASSLPFTSQSLKNGINECTKTIASRRREYEKLIGEYTTQNAFGADSKNIGANLLKLLNSILGGNSRILSTTDPFAGLSDLIFSSLTNNFKSNVGSKSSGGQSTVYTNTSDARKAIENMVGAVGGDLKKFMGYDYFKQRTNTNQGIGKAIDTFDTMQGELVNAMNMALNNGIGSFLQTTNGGKAFKLGFFNQADASKIFKTTKSGARTADWSLMASFDIGIPNKLGNMLLNGMSVADYMVGDLDKNGMVSYKTLSQTMMENISSMMKDGAVLNSLRSGDAKKAQYLINQKMADILPLAPRTGSYKDPASAAMDEILSDSKSGSTIEQSAMRASQMVNSRIYEQAYNKYFKQHGAYDSRKAAQMHDYTYAKYLDKLQGGNINSSVFDNNKDYQWLTDGSKIIDNIAGQMATISSNIGIGGLKEPTYNAGRFMGLDANVFTPFHALNVGSNRALSQAMNYTHRTNRAKTIQSNDLKLNRTLLDSAIGKQLGVNYGDAEHLQYTLGRTDDYAIYDAMNAYYDQLLNSGDVGKKQIDKLAQRYLSKTDIKGKSASDIVNMLKQSPMASVAEGGAVVSDTVMASLASKRIAESHKVTADDLKQLGINAPALGQSLKNFNTTDIKSVAGFNGIDLSSGLHIGANDVIKGITDIGDGFYQMDIDKQLPANAVLKVLTSNGDRLMARSIDDHMFDFISKKIGLDGAHLLTERKNYADTRKTAGAIQGRYEYLAQEYLRQGGNMEGLQKAISSTPVLKDFLSYADGGFHTKYSNLSAVKNFYQDHVDGKTFKNTEDVAKYLNDFNNTGGAFHTLAKSLFSGDNLKRVLNDNMESAALRMSNEYSYFDPVGSVSKTSALYDSRYKITPQLRDAMLRTLGLYGFMSSGGTSTLNRVFEQYMSHDAGTLSALEAEKRSLMNVRETSQIGDVAPNRIGQLIRIVDKPVDSLAANEIALSLLGTDNVYRPDGKIATADWNASVLGAVATKARELGGNVSGAYIDIENSGGAVTFDGKSYKSLGVPIMPTIDGDYTTPKPFEGEYNNLIKHLQSRSELLLGDPSRAYLDYAIGNAARNAYNDVFNATDNKGGYIRDQLENVRATNAIALKALATNIAQQDAGEKKIRNLYAEKLQDSLVMNPEDIKGMLRTGKGGDRLSNIEKLSWMYEDLLGTDTKTYKRVSTGLKNLQSGKTVDDSGKIAKGLESSLINDIMKAISLESGSGALSGLLHRYPLINGHDIKHLGIRVSEAVGRGRMVTGKGIERAINLDYDGDTGYASMALFGAKNKEEFMLANKEFKEIQNMQSLVNSLIGDMAIRKYQKDNAGSAPSMSEAMNKLYSSEGQKNTLLADLKAKGNFGKVGLLSNYSRDMRTTLFNNALDETGSNPLNAAQSMIARAFFESFEQNAISSKKIDSKIREATKGQSPDSQRAYLENSLSGILDYANNIGKADSNGVTRTWDGLIKLGLLSGIFGDDGKALISDRVSHQAVGNIQVMAEHRFGKGTLAYSNFMKSLGFSDNLIGQEYGANRPYEGALSAELVLKSLTSLEKTSMDKTGKSLSDNRWAARASYYGYTKLNNDAIDSIENSRMNRYQKAINAQTTMDRGATLDEAQRAGTSITGAGSEVVTLLANIAQTLGTLAGVTKNADVATLSYAQSLIQNVNAMNAGMSAAKGYAQVFNGEVAYAIGARLNANYDLNHKYDVTSPYTSDNGVLAYDYQGQTALYSVSLLAKILTGGGIYKDAETMKTLGSAIDGVRGTGLILTAEDFGLNGKSGAQRWDSLRQGYMKTELGTYLHANTLYVNEVNQALNDFIKVGGFAGNSGLYSLILGHVDAAKSMGLSNATEIRNNSAFAELFNTLSGLNMSELGTNNPFEALLGQLSQSAGVFKDAESRYTSTAKALGLGDHIQGDQAYVDTATTNMFKTILKLAGPNGYVSSEVALGIRLGDTTIAGAIDSLIYNRDTKTMTGLDNKNTSFTSNENVLLLMMYEGMLRMTQNQVRSGVKEFISNKENASNTDWVQNGKMTRAGYMEMAALAHAKLTDLMLGQASVTRTANLLEGFNEAEGIYTKLGTIAENGSTEVRSIIEAGVSKVINLMQMAAKGMQLSPEEIRGLLGYVSKIADIGSKQDGKDGVKRNNYGLLVAPTVATAEEKAAMARGIKGVRAADAASINMLRAQRAREDAYRTGNAQQITAAELLIEGIRREAEIANLYKPRFTMYDKSGKVVSATGADGKPVNIETLKGLVEKGILTTYNQDTQEWESTNLQRAQALKYQQQLNFQLSKYTQAVGKTSGQVKTLSSFIGSVVGGMKQTISYLMRTSLVYGMIGKVKQAFSSLIQTVYGLNKAYVDLRIASGQTDSEMKNSLKSYNQMAREMGKTTQEVANAANDWLRAGYNAQESAKLIKNSMQLSTVGMIDSAKATEYLISTMKGWKIGVDDMEGVVDKLTELDRNAAITAGDLAESMSRANVSAQLAGSGLNKYMAYLTTVSDVSQLAPESVGTAFKTLYSRYGNVKAGKFVAGAGDEDNGEEFEALNDIEKVLQKIGISMRTSTAEFRSFDEVIAEIANKWAVLSDVEQNAISTAFAGTRLREVFNVLMENFDEVSKYERIADQSAGTTALKMDIYSDSLEASKNRITAATEELTQKLFGGDMEEVLKTWNNLLAYIIKNADTLLTAFIGLTVIMKGLVSGAMFGGLAKLMLSILASGASFRNTMSNVGNNLYNSKIIGAPFRGLGKLVSPVGNGITEVGHKIKDSSVGLVVSDKAKQVSIWFGQTGVGKNFNELRTKTVDQIRDANVGKVYSAAYKAGVSGNMTAVLADKSALFLASLLKNPELFAKFNALSPERQLALLTGLSLDQDLADTTAVTSHLTTIESYLSLIVTNTGVDNVDTDAQRYDGLKTKYGTDSQGRIQWLKGMQSSNGLITENEMKEDQSFARRYRRAQKAELDTSKRLTNTKKMESAASFLAKNADELEAYASVKAAAQSQGMTGDDIARTGTIIKDKGVVGANQKASKFSGLGSGLAGVGSMAAMMGGTMLGSAAALKSGQSWTLYTGMGAGMLLSSGLAMGWNPAGWAMMIGGALLGIATWIGSMIKTSEKILEEAEEAKSAIAEGVNELKEFATEIENLKKQSSSFNKLASGVDPETGENVTLTDDEFSQYQDQLKEIINARDELYASYNKEGDLIAMRNGEIVKSNELMEEAIKLAQEEERLKALSIINDEDEIENSIKEVNGKIDKIQNLQVLTEDIIKNVSGKKQFTIANNVQTWDTPSNVGEGAYGWKIDLNNHNHTKQTLYTSKVDPTTFGANEANGTISNLPHTKLEGDYPINVSFDQGYLVDSLGYVITDVSGNPITQENASSFVTLSDDNEIVREGYEDVGILLLIRSQYMLSGNFDELITNLRNSGASTESIAEFLGIDADKVDDLLNNPLLLQKMDEIKEATEGFKREIGNILNTRLTLVITSIEGSADLDPKLLSLLNNSTTGVSLDHLSDEELKNYMNEQKEITKRLIEDSKIQDAILDYDPTIYTLGAWSERENGTTEGTSQYYLALVKKLYGGIIDGKNKVADDPVTRQRYINAGFEFIGDNVVTKQEYLANKLKDEGKNDLLGYAESGGHSIWRNFTESEMSTIYENYDLIASDSEVQGNSKQAKSDAIKRRVLEIMMVSYSALLLFGVLQSDIDNLAKKHGDIWSGTLSDGVGKYNEELETTSEAYHKLLEMAKRLGVESVEEFAKMSKSLKLDEFGYSTLSMLETEENFNQLESIRNLLDNEGTISAEEWDFLAQNFSDVVTKYSVEDMISAIDDALKAKEFLIEAEIKGTLAEDSDLFKLFSSIFVTDDTENYNWAKVLSGTTNIKQIQQLLKGLDLAQNNPAEEKKLIAKVFGIDLETGWEDKLNTTLTTNYNATYSQFVGGLKALNSDNIDIMGYWNEYINPIVELQKLIQKTAENNEAFANDLNDIKTDFDNGSISIDKYISRLKSLQNDSRASKEQLEELAETLEDATFSKISEEFKEGALSVLEFTSELSKLSKKNVVGSEDWETFALAAIDANDQQKKINDSLISMLGMQTNEDFTTKRTLQQQNINISLQKLAQIQAMGELEHGEDYNPENDAAFVEARDELYTEIKEYSETFTEQKSYLEDLMSKGNINGLAYIDSLSDMIATGELTTELLMEFSEAIEDATLSVLETSFERGSKLDADGKTVDSNYTGLEYRKDLLEELSKQARGSDDEKTILDAYFNSFDAEISRNESQIELIQEGYYDTTKYSNKYDAEKDVNKVNATLAYEKMESLKAAGYSEDSEEYKVAEAEAFKWMQASSDVDMQRAADFEEDYQNGSIGLEDFVHGLESISDSTDLTAEDLEELSEKLEDASYELSKLKFETGQITGDEYRGDLLTKILSNAANSEDEIKYKQAYLDSFGTEISANLHSIDLAQQGYYDTEKYSNKYSAQKDLNRSNAALAYELMLSARELFGEDSEQFRSALAEAVKWMEANSDVDMQKASDLREDYESGSIGLEEFVNSLEDISKSTDLTAEDLEELSEQIEDTKLELAKIKFEEGLVSGDDYRSEIMKKIQGNVEGSEDRRSAISQYISSYSSEVQKSEQQASLLADNDFSGKAKFVLLDIDTLTESLAFMEAAGLKNSEEYLKTVSLVVNKKKELLDLEKQIYEYEIKNSEEVLDAYSNILSYGIDELLNRQQDINDLYDDEISKLQDINDQKQRSIELTKLQQELENAKKEKVRVYLAGVGFTYQENKGAVKEAKQKLDEFDESQHIADLRSAQEAQNKLIEDEIKRLTDILDYISSIKLTADVTASLMDLKKHGIVPQNATISDAINQITQSAVQGASGKVESLGVQFGNFATIYTTNSNLLAQYTDELETKLSKISDLYMTYSSDAAMVSDFVTQLNTKIGTTGNPVKDTKDLVSTINDLLTTFLGGKNSPTVTTIDSHISEVSKAVNDKTIPDPTPDTGDIKTKLTQFIGESTASGIASKSVTDLTTAINNKKLIDPNDPTNPVNAIKTDVSSIKDRLNKLMGNQNFDAYLTSFKNAFNGVKVSLPESDNENTSVNELVAEANRRLSAISGQLSALSGTFAGTHKRGASRDSTWSLTDSWDLMAQGRFRYGKNNKSYIKIGDYWYEATNSGTGYALRYTVAKDALGMENDDFMIAYNSGLGYASGIENGPVTYTGLAMLHGSPSSPEYVLNSDLAGTLLKNLATMTMSPYEAPVVDSYKNLTLVVTYLFNGDMNLPNVLRPDQFFDELLKQANVQFPTIKRNYY